MIKNKVIGRSGENNPKAKLKQSDVDFIRETRDRLLFDYKVSRAIDFNTSPEIIQEIMDGKEHKLKRYRTDKRVKLKVGGYRIDKNVWCCTTGSTRIKSNIKHEWSKIFSKNVVVMSNKFNVSKDAIWRVLSNKLW